MLLVLAFALLSNVQSLDCLKMDPSPTGTQTVAIVLVEDDVVAGTQSRADLEYQLLNRSNPLSFASMLYDVSYGKLVLEGEVFPPPGAGYDWYHYDGDLGNPGNLQLAAVTLSDPDVDFTAFDRLVPLTSRAGFYGGPGLRTFETDEGCIEIPTATAGNGNLEHGWVLLGGNQATFNFGHEVGHTLAKDDVPAGEFQMTHNIVVKNNVPGAIYTTDPDDYTKAYFGQGFMFSNKIHPDVMVKEELFWLDPAQLAEIRDNGVYVVSLRSVEASRNGRVQCVKVLRSQCGSSDIDNICGGGGIGWYYLESRLTDFGGYPTVFVYIDAWRRTLAQTASDIAGSTMLDMFPAEPARRSLRVNETYVCPVYGTQIEVLPSFVGDSDVVIKITATALPPSAACVADISGPARPTIPDGVVDAIDVATVQGHFGTCPSGPGCLGDVTGPAGVPDGVVDQLDLDLVTNSQGVCPE